MRAVQPPFIHTSSWDGAYLSTGYILMALYLDEHRIRLNGEVLS